MFDLLQTALEHHQAGRLDQAEALYRQILGADPAQADALHLLGLVAQQRGQPAQAIGLIEQAIALNPGTAAYHANLAEAYRTAGNLAQALLHGRMAVQLDPDSAEARNNLGLALYQQGNHAEAVAHLEAAIGLRPFAPLPYANLGNLLREQGRFQEALAILREGLRLLPEAPQLRTNLGRVLLEMGLAGDALAPCREALRLRPDYAEGLCNLGRVLRALGRGDEGLACCQRALALEPRLALAYHFLGQAAREAGKLDEAIACYEQALQLDPHNPPVHCDLAAALYENEQPEKAIERYRLVTQRRPHYAEAYNNLGYVLQDQGDTEGAVAAYRAALRIRPDYADALVNLGLALAELGELEEAVAAHREALRHQPGHPEAYAALGLLLRDKLSAQDFATAEAVLASPSVSPKSRAVLQYGLVQVLDAQDRRAQAVEYVRQANGYFQEADRRRGRGYDPAEHQAYVEQILAAYTEVHFERVRGWGLATDLPVFIVGLPRSGTSLLEQILASHPQVVGGGELNFARDCYRAMPDLVGKNAPGIACVGSLDRDAVQTLARRYLDSLRGLSASAVRIVDKMPDNYLMLGLIATMFPGARIIHSRRDLRDVALSCWLTYFRHIRWSFDLEHIGARIREYQRLMEHWRRVLPVSMLEVDYEETVSDLEAVARRLVSWCGLAWNPACLAFHRTRRAVRTASMLQVREPVYTHSVKRWEKYQEFLAPLQQFLPIPPPPIRN